MAQLSQTGLRAVEEISQRTGFSRDAVTSMLFSLAAGGGGMAQFSHSEVRDNGWRVGRSRGVTVEAFVQKVIAAYLA